MNLNIWGDFQIYISVPLRGTIEEIKESVSVNYITVCLLCEINLIKTTPYARDVSLTYIRRSEDALDVF